MFTRALRGNPYEPFLAPFVTYFITLLIVFSLTLSFAIGVTYSVALSEFKAIVQEASTQAGEGAPFKVVRDAICVREQITLAKCDKRVVLTFEVDYAEGSDHELDAVPVIVMKRKTPVLPGWYLLRTNLPKSVQTSLVVAPSRVLP